MVSYCRYESNFNCNLQWQNLIRQKINFQGTFSVYEKLSHIYEFVTSCLKDESFDYVLMSPAGIKLSDEDFDKSLFDLRLIPNSILMFTYPSMTGEPHGNYLKEEILMLIQPM